MFDYDAIVVGAGPAGLTAGIWLARARYRVLVLEKEQFGGQLKDIDWIEDYPGFSGGVSGPELASAMIEQANQAGVEMELREVTGIESFSGCRSVTCADGRCYTAAAILVATGCRPKELPLADAERFRNKGMIHCVLCEGGLYTDRIVAVCGGGDTGVTQALYLLKRASKVIVVEAQPQLQAMAVLEERLRANPRAEIHCSATVTAIRGDPFVEEIDLLHTASQTVETLKVDGLFVAIGVEPNSQCLQDAVPLDQSGYVPVSSQCETETPYIFAMGDIRAGSPGQIATAVGDGAAAAIAAQRILQANGTHAPASGGAQGVST
jgi:thioredoxin reductase (NADPH)